MPQTPEIQRIRKANMLKNQAVMMGLGFDGGGNSGSIGGSSTRGGGLFPQDGAAGNAHQLSAATAGLSGSLRSDTEVLPLEALIREWPGREAQIHELAGLIGEVTDGVPVPPLLITGPPSTGKTGVVRAVLDYRGFNYVHVNCAEIVAKRGLLEAVVEQAAGSREDIVEANRVDRSFREYDKGDNFIEEGEGAKRKDPRGVMLGMDEEEEEADRQRRSEAAASSRRGKQRPACSSWNVFFRQLASLLARRGKVKAHSHHRANRVQSLRQQQQQQHRKSTATSAGAATGEQTSYGTVDGGKNDKFLSGENTAIRAGEKKGILLTNGNNTEQNAETSDGNLFEAGVLEDFREHNECGRGNSRPEGCRIGITGDHITSAGEQYGSGMEYGETDKAAIAVGDVTNGGELVIVRGGGGGTTNTSNDNGQSRSGERGGIAGAFSGGTEKDGGMIRGGMRGGGTTHGGNDDGANEIVEFPRKLFVVLDNAEVLLGESAAGVGVSAGGCGKASTSWRGPDLLARLARLPGMVASFTGFAGEGNTSSGHEQPAPICPILVSQNCFFASEIMSVGGDVVESFGHSLVARTCPVQLWFPPYSQKDLPTVLTATAHKFGNDLNINRNNTNNSSRRLDQDTDRNHHASGGSGGSGGGGNPRSADNENCLGSVNGRSGSSTSGSEGRKLFRKMAAIMVQGLRNESCDALELGAEAAKLWPAYRKMAEDGLDDSELAAGLKPLLVDTTKRLHGALETDAALTTPSASRTKSSRKRRAQQNLGLSTHSKHLLVAAYLASHNSRETDRDIFTAKRSKRKKKRMTGGAGNAENLVEAGVEDLPEAKEFQLERLLSIMTSLVAVTGADTSKASATGNTEIFMQLKSLTKLNLIAESGARRKVFDLDVPTYRCNVTREFAEMVAREIDLTLSQFLVAGH